MNIENKVCSFNFGIEQDASGSNVKSKPYNMHLYFCKKCVSISPVGYLFPIRFAFGKREVKTNFYLTLGFCKYNLKFDYKSKKLINALSKIIKGVCPNRFTVYFQKIDKVNEKRLYIIPYKFDGEKK